MKRLVIETPEFIRTARKFVRRDVRRVEALRDVLANLQADAHAPMLQTHKLKGDLKHCWAASAGYDIRVVFEFVDTEAGEGILLHTIGTHDEVY